MRCADRVSVISFVRSRYAATRQIPARTHDNNNDATTEIYRQSLKIAVVAHGTTRLLLRA